MRRRAREALSAPIPHNVRVEMHDGRVIPVELVYVGKRKGEHRWEAVTPIHSSDPSEVKAVLIDRLPARTGVVLVFGIVGDDDG